MIGYKTYKLDSYYCAETRAIEKYIKEEGIQSAKVILHCAHGEPLTFFKLYVNVQECGIILDETFRLNDTTLLIYGYTYLEEVPITHCEMETKGV